MDGIVDANEGVEVFENLINGSILAPAIPQPFDNSFVVTIYGEVLASCVCAPEVVDKTLEANSFCPTDVPLSL